MIRMLNNKLIGKVAMFIWGSIIVLVFLLIFLIGYKEKDRTNIKFENNLKKIVTSYVKNNSLLPKVNDSVIIFSEDLVKDDYLSEEDKDKHCIEKVIYYNGIIFDNITIDENCNSNKDKEE